MKSGIIGFVLGALVVGLIAYYPTQSRKLASQAVDTGATAVTSAVHVGASAANRQINAPPSSK